MNFVHEVIIANIARDLFGWLIGPLDSILRWLHDSAGLPWGLAIIALTVMVRLVLVPLTYKQITSMIHMQQFQPQIKELNEKYKEDPQRKQQELMKFFKEHKINPLASCLPILFQLPFFIAIFWALQDKALQTHIHDTGKAFLFIPDLVAKPSGAALVILLILYIGSQIGSTLVSLTPTTDDTQRKIMLALPFLFVPFIINFPAGLVVYWITTNTWTFGQAFVVRKLRADRLPAVGTESTDKDDKTGTVVASTNGADKSRQVKKPPPPPRQKRKRSGRRR